MKFRNIILLVSLVLPFADVVFADEVKTETTCSWRVFTVDAGFTKSETLDRGEIPVLRKNDSHIYFLLNQAKEGKFVMITYGIPDGEIHLRISHGDMGSRFNVNGSMTPMKKTGGYFSFEHGIKKPDGSYENFEISCIKPAI